MLFLFDTSSLHQTVVEHNLHDQVRDRQGHFLCCRNCRHKIVDVASILDVDGKTVHRYRNPFGNEYQFKSYSQAPGCEVTGVPTREHSWFAGYRWQYASCGECHVHLGWYYTGGVEFFGLIIANLVPCDQAGENS